MTARWRLVTAFAGALLACPALSTTTLDGLEFKHGIAFFGDLIELGVRNGEIRAEDARTMFDVISAVMMGLVSASSDNPETHARAVGGFKALVSGTLIDPDA